jgi:hypothetical protein
MLNWSMTAYKFTLGSGSLGIAWLLSDLFRDILHPWVGVALAIVPLLMFLFAVPGELPEMLVSVLHSVGAIWYLALTITLVSMVVLLNKLPSGWQFCLLLIFAGAFPCLLVLYRVATGSYRHTGQTPTHADP